MGRSTGGAVHGACGGVWHARVVDDDLTFDCPRCAGTVTERPNWQRRVQSWADSLDPERAQPAAAAAISALVAARPGT